MIINVHAHIREGDDPDRRVHYYAAPGMEKVCLHGDDKLTMQAHKLAEDFIVPIARGALGKTTPADVEAFSRDGFYGVHFSSAPAPYDAEEFFPVYEKMEELGMPAFFRTGHIRGGAKCRIEYTRPTCLDTIARFFPGLYIVGSQLGSPWFFEAMAAMLYNERVYFDMSGGVLRGLPLSWFRLMFMFKDVYLLPGGIRHRMHDESINRDIFRKIVFGTGGPQPEVVEAFYRDLFTNLQVDFETQGLILWGNASRMLGLGEFAKS
jgi:predicted TIM-barrel fold metal-dependent hydrolase